jgi:hypothetical protein
MHTTLKKILATEQSSFNKAIKSKHAEYHLEKNKYGAWEIAKLGYGNIPFWLFQFQGVSLSASFALSLGS